MIGFLQSFLIIANICCTFLFCLLYFDIFYYSLSGWQSGVVVGEKAAPSIVKTTFMLSAGQISDTFLDITDWKRGVVYVNGFNIGRYFSGGPQLTMYIPAPLLKVGQNSVSIEHWANKKLVNVLYRLPTRFLHKNFFTGYILLLLINNFPKETLPSQSSL